MHNTYPGSHIEAPLGLGVTWKTPALCHQFGNNKSPCKCWVLSVVAGTRVCLCLSGQAVQLKDTITGFLIPQDFYNQALYTHVIHAYSALNRCKQVAHKTLLINFTSAPQHATLPVSASVLPRSLLFGLTPKSFHQLFSHLCAVMQH